MRIVQNLQPTLNMSFRAAYNRYIAKRRDMVMSLYMEDEIQNLESEEYWLGDIPAGVREWVGPRTYQELAKFKKKLVSKPWTTPGWRYNRVQNTGPNIMQLMQRMTATINRCEDYIDRHCVDLLVNGEVGKAYDNIAFFEDGTSRSFSNLMAGGGTDTSKLKRDLIKAIELFGKMKTNTGEQIELEPSIVLVPLGLFLDMAEVIKSASSTDENKNSGVYNSIREFGLRVQWTRKLTGNNWYLISNTEGMAPTYWQTTLVEGSRIILDIDETNLASEGWYGIAASIYGIGEYGLPFTCVKVKN